MNHKKQINKEDLEQLYLIERKSPREIGEIYNCSAATIANRLSEYNIPKRNGSEALKGRANTWGHKAAEKNRGKKRPGIGGRMKGCVGWSKGLSKTTDDRLANTGKSKQDHWAWKGGISGEHALIRQTSEYKQWRKCVFERDKFSCRRCGRISGKLEAHHVSHFATDVENRFNVDNGITLCSACHAEQHREERIYVSKE